MTKYRPPRITQTACNRSRRKHRNFDPTLFSNVAADNFTQAPADDSAAAAAATDAVDTGNVNESSVDVYMSGGDDQAGPAYDGNGDDGNYGSDAADVDAPAAVRPTRANATSHKDKVARQEAAFEQFRAGSVDLHIASLPAVAKLHEEGREHYLRMVQRTARPVCCPQCGRPAAECSVVATKPVRILSFPHTGRIAAEVLACPR